MNDDLRRAIAEAWSFRTRVERDAARRFARLASAIAAFDAASPVIGLMDRAAEDERRHAALCAGLSAAYGRPVDESDEPSAAIAPSWLGRREAILYEVVAACCITETESVATVATLLAGNVDAQVRKVLHEIARDEVAHGRMGWAHLAREAATRDVSFLSPLIPAMLSGTIDDGVFTDTGAEPQAEELSRHGVLRRERKREIFLGTLQDVVLPGLASFHIDVVPARAWIERRLNGPPFPERSPASP